MSLEAKINNDLKEAMKNKDQVALRGIRAVKAAILLNVLSYFVLLVKCLIIQNT